MDNKYGSPMVSNGAIGQPVNYTLPEIGDWYTTHNSGVIGWVCEIVPNRTGTFRLRLRTLDLETRWTTFIPEGVKVNA